MGSAVVVDIELSKTQLCLHSPWFLLFTPTLLSLSSDNRVLLGYTTLRKDTEVHFLRVLVLEKQKLKFEHIVPKK